MSSNDFKFGLAFADHDTIFTSKLPNRSNKAQRQQGCLRQLEDDDIDNVDQGNSELDSSEDASTTNATDRCLSDTVKSLKHSLCADKHIPNLHEIKWFFSVCQAFHDRRRASMPDEEIVE